LKLVNTKLWSKLGSGLTPIVRDKDGHLAIAKFPRKDDEINIIAWEAVALSLANKAGIEVPEWRMETVARQQILLSRRFEKK
jgi:serine/threonine-protein kinase HipA